MKPKVPPAPTPSGQQWIIDPKKLFHLKTWKEQGAALARQADAKTADQGKALWALGDWLLNGEELSGLRPRPLKHAAVAATGYSWGRLKNLKVISRAIPERRRRPSLSYSIHVEVAALDEPAQEQLLNEAIDRQATGKTVSVRDVRRSIKYMMSPKDLQRKRSGKGGGLQTIVIAVVPEWEQKLKVIGNIFDTGYGAQYGNGVVGKLIALICLDYFEKHKDQINAAGKEFFAACKAYEADKFRAARPPRPLLPGIDKSIVDRMPTAGQWEYIWSGLMTPEEAERDALKREKYYAKLKEELKNSKPIEPPKPSPEDLQFNRYKERLYKATCKIKKGSSDLWWPYLQRSFGLEVGRSLEGIRAASAEQWEAALKRLEEAENTEAVLKILTDATAKPVEEPVNA